MTLRPVATRHISWPGKYRSRWPFTEIIYQLLYSRFYPNFRQTDATGANNRSVASADFERVDRVTFHKQQYLSYYQIDFEPNFLQEWWRRYRNFSHLSVQAFISLPTDNCLVYMETPHKPAIYLRFTALIVWVKLRWLRFPVKIRFLFVRVVCVCLCVWMCVCVCTFVSLNLSVDRTFVSERSCLFVQYPV